MCVLLYFDMLLAIPYVSNCVGVLKTVIAFWAALCSVCSLGRIRSRALAARGVGQERLGAAGAKPSRVGPGSEVAWL